MPKSDIKKDLEKALDSGDTTQVTRLLKKAFLNTIELKIRTRITEGDGPKEIFTKINLLDGDIETTIHKDFIPNPEEAANFHKEQVNKGEEIIARNVNTLKNLAQSLIELF